MRQSLEILSKEKESMTERQILRGTREVRQTNRQTYRRIRTDKQT